LSKSYLVSMMDIISKSLTAAVFVSLCSKLYLTHYGNLGTSMMNLIFRFHRCLKLCIGYEYKTESFHAPFYDAALYSTKLI
jgi:hypothetical protein